jgi:hypothetical protein
MINHMKPLTYKFLAFLGLALIILGALGVGGAYLCQNEFNHLGCPVIGALYSMFGHEAGNGIAILFAGFFTYLITGLVGICLLVAASVAGKKTPELRPRPKTLLLSGLSIVMLVVGTVMYQRLYEIYTLPGIMQRNFESVTGTTPEEAQNKQCPGGLLGVALVRYQSCAECDKAEAALNALNLGGKLQVFNLESENPGEMSDPSGAPLNLRDVLFARINTEYQLLKHKYIYQEPGSSFSADKKESGVMVSACGDDLLFDFTGKQFDLAPVRKEINRGLTK